MKIDFPYWGILDTADAKDEGDYFVWIKQHPSGPQKLLYHKDKGLALAHPVDMGIMPVIYKRKHEPS